MDAVERRLMALETEVKKLRRRIRDGETKDQFTLDSPLNAASLGGEIVRVLFGYGSARFEQSDVGLGSEPFTYIDHQVTGGEGYLTLAAIHSNLSTPFQPYARIKLNSAGEITFETSGPGSAQPTTTVTFDENGIAVNGSEIGGAMKITGGGYYLIPAGPGVGTTVASSTSADTYGSWTEMRAASGNALYIVGVSIYARELVQYTQLDIGTGAAASETSVSETLFNTDGGTVNGIDQTVYFPYPIAVAASTRIACRTADEDASARNSRVTLIVVDQADVAAL